MKIKDILNDFADVLYPKSCISCGKLLEFKANPPLCVKCQKELKIIDKDKRCKNCGLPKDNCDCNKYIYYFYSVVSVFENNGAAKNIIYRYKLGKKKYYAKYLSDYMVKALKEEYRDMNFDFLVPVPSAFRLFGRAKFNHTYLLAKMISKKSGIPLKNNIISAKPFKLSQHKSKNTEQRINNVEHKYRIRHKCDAENVLLIDDIKTTGATLNACARELMFAGARKVYCLTASESVRKKDKNEASEKILKNNKK